MLKNILVGAIAGSVGTIALDTASYVDMLVQGRAASDLPADVVERIARRAGITWLTKDNEAADPNTKHRRSAAGALMGYGVGIGIGKIYGLVRPCTRSIPWPFMGVLLGAAAMAASDIPAAQLEATNPSTWSPSAWASDVVPHLCYGLFTAWAWDYLNN